MATAAARLEDLAWLEGTWANDTFEARYTSPQGGMILSVCKEFEDGKAIFFELERFEARGDQLVMVPYPKGVESVPFTLVSHDAARRRAVFENKAHDWPTDFVFERAAEDRLVILVGGPGQDGGRREWRLELNQQR